jgi:N-acetylglutamate synthase-like GNAT family acetyltransferase
MYRVAELNGEIVGCLHASTYEDGTKELEAIYLSPETFGSGIGAKLMEPVIDWVGNKDMTVKVATYNDRARKFYQKYGFEQIPGSDDVYADTIPMIRMIRKGVTHEI